MENIFSEVNAAFCLNFLKTKKAFFPNSFWAYYIRLSLQVLGYIGTNVAKMIHTKRFSFGPEIEPTIYGLAFY